MFLALSIIGGSAIAGAFLTHQAYNLDKLLYGYELKTSFGGLDIDNEYNLVINLNASVFNPSSVGWINAKANNIIAYFNGTELCKIETKDNKAIKLPAKGESEPVTLQIKLALLDPMKYAIYYDLFTLVVPHIDFNQIFINGSFNKSYAKELSKELSDNFTELQKHLSIKANVDALGINIQTPVIQLYKPKKADDKSNQDNAGQNGLGRGAITYGKRSITDTNQFDYLFEGLQPQYTDPILHPDGDVDFTVQQMSEIAKRCKPQTAKLAQYLKGKDLINTCYNIHQFFVKYYQYAEDSKFTEQIREPIRAYYDRKTGIDCDCFSTSVSSILLNLKIKHCFRITKYEKSEWQHVYVVVPDGNGYIVIDCVISEFDFEKEPTAYRDFFVKP